MSSRPQTSDFVLNIIHPLIQSFLEKTTTEQWGSFLSSSADDATKVLVAELILEIIAALSNSVVASMKSGTPKPEEHLMSELEVSLPQTFSEALGIPDEVDDISLKTLTGIIQEEVKYNLISGGKAGVTKRLTPVARLNAMTAQLTQLFQKFSVKIKTFIAPRPWKSKTVTPKGTKKSQLKSQVISKINDELSDIINPLLEDIPNSEELLKEVSRGIQEVADKTFCSTCGTRHRKPSALKNIRKKMQSVLIKYFAKVCLMRMLNHLKKKYSKETSTISDSVDIILISFTSQLMDNRYRNIENEDSFLLMFKDLHDDKVLVFSQQLSDLIYRHVLPEPLPRSVLRSSFEQSSFAFASQSKVHADVWSKTWIFMVLMNWFLTTQINSLTDRLTLLLMGKSASRMIEFSLREQDPEKKKKYVTFMVEKVVFTICSDANMVPETRDKIINNLIDTVWNNVQDEEFYIRRDVFKNIKKTIRKSLYQNVGSPEYVLFLTMHEDPIIVDRIMLVINKKLLRSQKEKNAFGKIFSFLGSTFDKIFKRKTN